MTTLVRFVELAAVFGLLMLWAVVSTRLPQRKPAAAGWPPPVADVDIDAAFDRLLTAVLADPWGPPDPATKVYDFYPGMWPA